MKIETAQRLLECFSDEHSMIVAVGKAIGARALRQLTEAFPGEHLYIPPWERLCAGLQRDMRNADIALRYNGRNGQELADEHDLSLRMVRKIASQGSGKRGTGLKDSSASNVVNRRR